jgi:hypothetical protein
MESTRRTPRYRFVASAELTREPAGTKLEAQVKELSLYGCYLDTAWPLPVRTRVNIRIDGLDEFFQATATVVYANATLGMGLAFRDVRPAYLEVLRRWLLQASQQGAAEPEGPARPRAEHGLGEPDDAPQE